MIILGWTYMAVGRTTFLHIRFLHTVFASSTIPSMSGFLIALWSFDWELLTRPFFNTLLSGVDIRLLGSNSTGLSIHMHSIHMLYIFVSSIFLHALSQNVLIVFFCSIYCIILHCMHLFSFPFYLSESLLQILLLSQTNCAIPALPTKNAFTTFRPMHRCLLVAVWLIWPNPKYLRKNTSKLCYKLRCCEHYFVNDSILRIETLERERDSRPIKVRGFPPYNSSIILLSHVNSNLCS